MEGEGLKNVDNKLDIGQCNQTLNLYVSFHLKKGLNIMQCKICL